MKETARQNGLVLGVTGSAGSGKSTVTQMLATLGAQTADADALVRWVYNSEEFKAKLIERFGSRVLDARGEIDRKALADIVFQNRRELEDLERLVHPEILNQIAGIIDAYRRDSERAAVLAIEVQLLFEAGADAMVDKVVTVSAPDAIRRSRLAARGWDGKRIAAVEQSQMPAAEKEARADYVVSAGGTIEETADEVEHLWLSLVDL